MNYLDIRQETLVNLQNALNIELIRSNRAGAYAMTTVVGCNTRKYHCMLAVPLEDRSRHVLLSSLDETIIQQGASFRLGIHKYKGGNYDPHGHIYIKKLETDPSPARIYQVGGVILKKEQLLAEEEDCVLLRYTVLDLHSPTKIRFQPFLAFRSIHSLVKANMNCNSKVTTVENGIKTCLYEGYPELYMQFSKKTKFVSAPDWYLDIEYERELERGYEATEDLFVPGYFELDVKKGDTFVFAAGVCEQKTSNLKKKFESVIESRIPRTNFENCLLNSAQQFLNRRNRKNLIIAGFPWYGFRFRETIISLPGLTLPDHPEKFIEILDSLISEYQTREECFTLDIPLLLIRAVQQFIDITGESKDFVKKYKEITKIFIEKIFSSHCGMQVRENGLIYIPKNDLPVSWMDETENGKAIVQRYGYLPEINALWYNALMFLSQLSKKYRLAEFKDIIGDLPEKIEESYTKTFWNETDQNLFDFVSDTEQNIEIRPNQLFSLALPHSPLEKDKRSQVLKKVRKHLLTDRGLRTLSPKSPNFVGTYSGNEAQRRLAVHQGTVHPWLIGLYCDALLNIYGNEEIPTIESIYLKFENTIKEDGLGTISELYDGNPPHKGKGAVSYAPSVAELLRIKHMLDKSKNNNIPNQ